MPLTGALMAAALAAAPRPQTIPLAPLRERLRTVQVEVNGQTGTFLFDTGGGVTIISPAFAKRIGCQPWGRLTGFRMMGQRLDSQRCDNLRIRAGGVELGPVTAGVLAAPDLKPGEPEPDGSLALDAIGERPFTLDVSANRLVLETPQSLAERARGGRELPIRIARELSGAGLDVYAPVPTPKGLLWFLIDSGNGGTVLVAKDMAGFFGLDPAKAEPQHVRIPLAADVVAESDMGFTPDMIMDGNLGMPFLRRYAVTVDPASGRMWIRPSAAPPAQPQAPPSPGR